MTAATKTDASFDVEAPAVSLQAQMEQLEAAAREAHGIIDGILNEGQDASSTTDEAGAEAAGHRVMQSLQSLISRLNGVASRVGTL